jgi:methanogenic corrinoid protein MtbC1
LSGVVIMAVWREDLLQSFLDCDRAGTRAAIEAALADGVSLNRLVVDAIQPAFDDLDALWGAGQVALTQIFLAARAVEEALDAEAAAQPPAASEGPKVVLGTLLDGHTLGARLVGIFLRARGVAVVEAGAGLSPEELAARAVAENARVLAVSVLMLRSATRIVEVRRLLQRDAPRTRLAVGGAPFRADPDLARRVGADAWAADALQAAEAIFTLANKP